MCPLQSVPSSGDMTCVLCLSPVFYTSLHSSTEEIWVRKTASFPHEHHTKPLPSSTPGNARLQGLPQDTLHGDPTGKLFDWVNSVFFFSYILVQIPATVLSKLFRPKIWLGCAAIGT